MISDLLLNLKEFAELGCSACEVCKYHDIDNCPHLGVVREAILLLERQGKLLQERSDGICELRRNWTAAEMKICSMCGKFLHGATDTAKGDVVFATDGNGVVCGTRICGELIGYPRCGKFTPWIPVSERLPEKYYETDEDFAGDPIEFIVHIKDAICATFLCFDGENFFDQNTGEIYAVTHWMELPEPPKEDIYGQG